MSNQPIRFYTAQEWHYHSNIEETLLITKGALTSHWMENRTSFRSGGN